MQKNPTRESGFSALDGLLVLFIGLFLCGIGWMVYYRVRHSEPLPTSSQPHTQSQYPTVTKPDTSIKTFTNSSYHLSFDYPSTLTVDGSSNNQQVSLSSSKDSAHSVTIEFVDTSSCQSNMQTSTTFLDFASQTATCFSAALGPEGGSGFDKLTQQIAISSYTGLTGYKLYFQWSRYTFDSNGKRTIVSQSTAGPVLAYDVSKATSNTLRAVEISIMPYGDTPQIDATVLDFIGNSLRSTQ